MDHPPQGERSAENERDGERDHARIARLAGFLADSRQLPEIDFNGHYAKAAAMVGEDLAAALLLPSARARCPGPRPDKLRYAALGVSLANTVVDPAPAAAAATPKTMVPAAVTKPVPSVFSCAPWL